MKPYGCIYGLCSPSGKWYIGQTTDSNPMDYILRQYKYSNGEERPKLKNALLKYGFNSIEIKIFVYLFNKESLDIAEVGFIEMYDSIKNGYNCKEGGSRGKHSLDTIEKMRLIQKNRFRSNEEIKDLILRNKTRITSRRSHEWAIQLGKNSKGKITSEDTKEKIRKTKLVYKYTILSPDDKLYEVTNLTEFCKNKCIHVSNMSVHGCSHGYKVLSKINL